MNPEVAVPPVVDQATTTTVVEQATTTPVVEQATTTIQEVICRPFKYKCCLMA